MNIGRNRRVVSCPCFSGELIRYERLFLSTPVQFGKWFNVAGNTNDSLSVQTDCYQTRPLETFWKQSLSRRWTPWGFQNIAGKTHPSDLGSPMLTKEFMSCETDGSVAKETSRATLLGYSLYVWRLSREKVGENERFPASCPQGSVLGLDTNPVHSGRTAYGRRVLPISDVLRCTVVVACFFWLWFSPSSMLHLVGLVFRLPTWPPWSWVWKNCR